MNQQRNNRKFDPEIGLDNTTRHALSLICKKAYQEGFTDGDVGFEQVWENTYIFKNIMKMKSILQRMKELLMQGR